MAWKKEGMVFVPNNHYAWMVTHAQVPTVLVKENCLTVFFATRNRYGQSCIAKIDLDKNNPKKIIKLNNQPILLPGNPGTFDEDGVMPSSIIKKNNELWLYYTGWNKKVSTPYHNAIGVAVSKDDGETFTRIYEGPIIDRTMHEPYIAITPCVIIEKNIFKMWYASGTRWLHIQDKYEPVYVIKFATSIDGLNWQRANQTCILPRHEQEALCTPSIIMDNGCYKMWFSFRNSMNYRNTNANNKGSYRIGYAESQDGISWNRMDEKANIDVAKCETAWDSAMICYPFVFKINNQLYMMYNGNGFGYSGFGYAIHA